MKDINKKTKTKLLLSFLENVPFDGWSWETLYLSAVDVGLTKSKNYQKLKRVMFEPFLIIVLLILFRNLISI